MIKHVIHIIGIAVVLYLGIKVFGVAFLETKKLGFALSFTILLILFTSIELVIHPIIRLIFAPIRWITLGIASVLISVVMVHLVILVYPSFTVSSGFTTLLLGFIFAFFQGVKGK